ncbi:MAG TPA: hypothetical protein VKB59_10280 [Micromonosporaceae bacterium]|nr:hypothetical protein [Micromonosporaceae bacterium]
MNLRTRVATTIATAALAGIGVVGLAACTPSQAVSTAMTPEATALTALGFTDNDVTTSDGSSTGTDDTDPAPGAVASASARPHRPGHPGLRRLLVRRAALGKHLEHGSVTVQTKNGDVTIDVQRGVITAINSTTMTVKSADGFTLTWTFGPNMRVIENRGTIQPSAVHVGETVGVAGEKNGSTEDARLVVIPKQ